MNIQTDVANLFSNTTKGIDKRDTSTVRRSKLDDGMFDNMVDQAELFKAAVERAPDLATEGEGGSREYVPHWGELCGDVFKSLHTYEDPGVLSQDEIKPSYEINRRVMQNIIGSDDFQAARPITRHSEIEAAFTTIGMGEKLRDTLKTEMKDLADEAQDAEKNEKQIERQEEKAEEIRQQVREANGNISDAQKDALEDAVNRKHNAQARLEKNIDNMSDIPLTRGGADGIAAAAKQGKDDAKLIASIPGIGKGEKQQLSPDEAIRLAQMFKDNPRLMQIAEMLGRILRDMRFKRARRISGGHEEVVDVDMGDDLELTLMAEKMKLMNPLMKKDFMRRFLEQSVMQYEMQGTEEAGYGPLIICRDESASMSGQRNIWAAAVSLALISIARKEKRDSAVVAYASSGEQETWVFPANEPFDAEKVVEMAGHFFHGGTTDATPAIREAVNLTSSDLRYTKADLVLISDGEDRYEDEDMKLRDELQSRGVRMHGVMVGARPSKYLDEMCETLVSAYDLAGSNEATDMLAQNIS